MADENDFAVFFAALFIPDFVEIGDQTYNDIVSASAI
jgi:hypothetical protein